jgi:hypothetical protein
MNLFLILVLLFHGIVTSASNEPTNPHTVHLDDVQQGSDTGV